MALSRAGRRDLIVTYGGQRIWPLFVTGPGELLPRFVSALKLAPACTPDWNSVRCSKEASNRRGPNENPAVIDKAESASLQSQ